MPRGNFRRATEVRAHQRNLNIGVPERFFTNVHPLSLDLSPISHGFKPFSYHHLLPQVLVQEAHALLEAPHAPTADAQHTGHHLVLLGLCLLLEVVHQVPRGQKVAKSSKTTAAHCFFFPFFHGISWFLMLFDAFKHVFGLFCDPVQPSKRPCSPDKLDHGDDEGTER